MDDDDVYLASMRIFFETIFGLGQITSWECPFENVEIIWTKEGSVPIKSSLELVTSRSTENIAERGHHTLCCLDQIGEGEKCVAENEFTFIRAIENIGIELA